MYITGEYLAQSGAAHRWRRALRSPTACSATASSRPSPPQTAWVLTCHTRCSLQAQCTVSLTVKGSGCLSCDCGALKRVEKYHALCTGIASVVAPALPVLDALYATRATLERLAARYGDLPAAWPPGVVRQLRGRHNALCARVQTHICSLAGAEYYPAGEPQARLSHQERPPHKRKVKFCTQLDMLLVVPAFNVHALRDGGLSAGVSWNPAEEDKGSHLFVLAALPGPRSRALLQSGVEGLAPGERLPERAGAGGRAAPAAAPKQDVVPADLDSDEEDGPSEDTPRQPQVLNHVHVQITQLQKYACSTLLCMEAHGGQLEALAMQKIVMHASAQHQACYKPLLAEEVWEPSER